MTAQLAIAPSLVALAGAVGTLVLRRWPRVQVVASVASVLCYAGVVAVLVRRVVFAPATGPEAGAGALVYQLGGWPAPYGITLVADGLSTFMLAMVTVVAVATLVFSTSYVGLVAQRTFYHPLFHFLLFGVTGAFLTGDLFNLFVWFEVTLMASYAFVAFYGGALHTRAALRYVAINLIASAVMLLSIGGLYAVTGTLNMADMARRLANPAAFGVNVAPVVGFSALLLSVFALKAGLVPFQFWVPGAYRAAPPPVAAMLAGATKKVGIYAIVRLSFTVFAAAQVRIDLIGIDGVSPLAFYGPLLFVAAIASVLVGGLGAVHADTFEGVFAYSSISQIGFITIPVAIGAAATAPELRRLAVLAALVYALNHALSKGLLFLVAGAIEDATGTSHLQRISGLAARSPIVAGAFLVGALSLVGVPPLSGFFGKFLAFDAAVRARSVLATGLLLGGTGLTIAYTTRTWNLGFWGATSEAVEEVAVSRVQVAVLACLAGTVVAVGVGFEPVYRFADAAATAAVDRGAYVDLVLGSGAEADAEIGAGARTGAETGIEAGSEAENEVGTTAGTGGNGA